MHTAIILVIGGKIIGRNNTLLQISTLQAPFFLVDLPGAMYFIHVSDYNGRTVTRKIVKL